MPWFVLRMFSCFFSDIDDFVGDESLRDDILGVENMEVYAGHNAKGHHAERWVVKSSSLVVRLFRFASC